MATTLLIMAAGLGSRYGGNKQIDRIGPGGEILMEYSIHDAVRAGFDRVVFVIRKHMAETFHAMIGEKNAQQVEVRYAFQEYDSLPGGFVPQPGRTKPYGTVHAVTCARNVIDGPFAVINADDYYGRDAFAAMAQQLQGMQGKEAAMVGYRLRNTVSENGCVTRGVCQVDENGNLASVTERYEIMPYPDGTIRDRRLNPEGDVLPPDAPVSMNFWGFTPWFFDAAEAALADFLQSEGDPMKMEYPLPTLVDTLMKKEALPVKVLTTEAVWFGVTYQEDKPTVAQELKKLHDSGFYPPVL